MRNPIRIIAVGVLVGAASGLISLWGLKARAENQPAVSKITWCPSPCSANCHGNQCGCENGACMPKADG